MEEGSLRTTDNSQLTTKDQRTGASEDIRQIPDALAHSPAVLLARAAGRLVKGSAQIVQMPTGTS